MLGRPLVVIAVTVAFATALPIIASVQGAPNSDINGDADCSGTVTMSDAAATLRLIVDPSTPTQCRENADVNCDGKHTPDDAIRIAAYVAGAAQSEPVGCVAVARQRPPKRTKSPPPTPSPTRSPTPAPSPTPTPTSTPTPISSPSPSRTLTSTPSATPTPLPTPTPVPTPTSSAGSSWVTGVEPECAIFPPNNPWNQDVSQLPVHPQSVAYLGTMSTGDLHPDFGTVWAGAPIGIPYVIVQGNQPKVPVSFFYASESDPGPYPIPNDVPVEGQGVGQPNTANFGGDRHVIVIDDENCLLYETFDSHPVNAGQSWTAGSGAAWNLNSNALRPETWTSADAAGLPIFAGLVRYSEVQSGVIDHALRFTVSDTQMAYIHPATHYASDIEDPDYPPMGARFRMKANYNCSWATWEVQVICAAMKKYGMIVADNGSDWYVSGAPDSRWDDDRIGDVKDIPASAFEVVDTGEPIQTGY